MSRSYTRFLRSISLALLSIAVGGTFIYSAYTKILPIQPFEYTLVEQMHLPWLLASVAARLLIGIEAALGALLLLHLFGRRHWIPKTAMTLLLVLSIYLIWLWINKGNNVNCGCFGDTIWMSPSSSLIKNAVLLLATLVITRFHTGWQGVWVKPALAGLALLGLIVPFVLAPIPVGQPSWTQKGKHRIQLQPLYNPIIEDSATFNFSQPVRPATNLEQGKHIVAFLSPQCEHCQIAARKMALIHQNNPNIPFLLVIGGMASDLTDFWKNTNAQNLPWMRLHRDPFLAYTGGVFPYIVLIDDGWVVGKATYNTLSQSALQTWLKPKP